MKKLIIIFTIICFANLMKAQTFSHHDYPYSDSVFNNPERGFYKYTERNDASSALDLGTLTSYREQGYTLIYRIFYMRDFVNSPISQAYLDKIKEDFSKMREAGIKGIIRFAYTSSMTVPYEDASPTQINKHISQLKSILTDNADVIMVLQAGFIGAWGEWYYTDHFATGSPSNVTNEDMLERKVLIDTLLDALPKERMIQVRYVGYKMRLFDSIPVTLEDAYSGKPKSRISHHNDCFVSSDNDVGSYKNIVKEKTYLEQDTKYTSIGGETCEWYPLRSNCDTSTNEMARFHWSFINQDYFGQTIKEWEKNGCYTDMKKKLGYRYSLINAEIQDSSKQNSSFTITFKMKNDGYTNPINPRNLEIVLKNKITGKLFYSRINSEIRKQELNTTFEYNTQIGIPSYMPNGDYEAYLSLPDPKPTLRNNPNYSIHLANNNAWDKSLGMNSLKHTLHINGSSTGTEYTGDNYFLGYTNDQLAKIKVDGSVSDWNTIPVADSSSSNSILQKVKVYNYNDTIFFLLQGSDLHENCQIFIDADFDNNTGMNYWTWSNDGGMDYLIQNNELFRYNGSNGSADWNWSIVSKNVMVSKNSNAIELAVPESFFTPGLKNKIRFGIKNVATDWATSESLPEESHNLLINQVIPYLHPPKLHLTSYCQNAIISFAPEQQDTSSLIVIERNSGGTNDSYSMVSSVSGMSGNIYYKDNDLLKNTLYSYRAYSLKNDDHSPYSDIKSITTGDCKYKFPEISADANDNDWNAVVPLNAVRENNKEVFFKTYCSTNYLNVLLAGDSIVNYSVFIDTDNNPLTGESNLNWKTSGFDFTCTNDSIYKNGVFKGIAKIDSITKNEHTIEFKIPFDLLEIDNSKKYMNFAAIVKFKNNQFYIPYKNRKSSLYERILPPVQPQNFEVRNSAASPSDKLIASWNKCTDCDGYVLTRTDQSTNETTAFDLLVNNNQLIDSPLKKGNSYQYEVYSYNFSGKSVKSGPINQSTTTLTGINDESKPDKSDDILLWPVPVKEEVFIRFMNTVSDPVLIKIYTADGKLVYSRKLKPQNDSQQVRISTAGLVNGVYLLHVYVKSKLTIKKLVKE